MSLITDNQIVDTPMELNARYAPTGGTPLPDPTLYQILVVSLIYLTVSCPNISYVMHIVGQFVASPTIIH